MNDAHMQLCASENGRLGAAGFGAVRVHTHDLGWVCTAQAG